jgi:hypothetical protein
MADLQTHGLSGLEPPNHEPAKKKRAWWLPPPSYRLQPEEARLREVWPSVARWPAIASLGRTLTGTIILAPLGWLVMSLVYFGKVAPGMPGLFRGAIRYTLTNRRLMIRRGWQGKPSHEIALSDIDDVRVVTDANSDFFRAATLEVISKGQVALTIPGVPEAECFRQAILNTRNAYVPGKVRALPFVPASAAK